MISEPCAEMGALCPGISVGGGAAGPGASMGACVECRLKHWGFFMSKDETL